jgi:hypothetical protein
MSVPLVGFAVRLKPSSETSSYDCEYSGYYRSSVIVGPLRNGAPCRSTVANDPLEGIQIRIVKRPSTAAANAGATGSIEPQHPGIKAPSFGRYRDTEAGSVNGDPKTSASPSKPAKRTKSADAAGKSDRTARSANRSPNRLS